MNSAEWLVDEDLLVLLETGDLEIDGRLADASNATLRCVITAPDGRRLTCVYKPVAGERPLWDFPQWTLTHREMAAYAVSNAAGWDLVPPTVWREDGPIGAGMCQLWIDEDVSAAKVAVVRARRAPQGWLHVLDAEDGAGRDVQLVHAPDHVIQTMAVFDAIVNNADRKGGHVITDFDGRTWGIDHGVAFSADEKLRTVLWGWSGEQVPARLLRDLERLSGILGTAYDPVDRWLADDERDVLRQRIRRVLATERFPRPPARWPAVPWPVF
jgi:uncharacterized repeat protein (TIGR03843 family)